MRKVALFFLLSSTMIMGFPDSIFSTVNKSVIYHLENPEQKADLNGTLDPGDLRSGTDKPIEVYVSHYLIGVTWLADMNNITVEVLNGMGQSVYHNKVNTAYGDQLLIYTTNWTSGYYTIYFTSAEGRSMYGELTISN